MEKRIYEKHVMAYEDYVRVMSLDKRIDLLNEITVRAEKYIEEKVGIESQLHAMDKVLAEKEKTVKAEDLEKFMRAVDEEAEKLLLKKAEAEFQIFALEDVLNVVAHSVMVEFAKDTAANMFERIYLEFIYDGEACEAVVDKKYPGLLDRYETVYDFIEDMYDVMEDEEDE